MSTLVLAPDDAEDLDVDDVGSGMIGLGAEPAADDLACVCSARVSLNEVGKWTMRSLPPLPWVMRMRQASRSTSSRRMATSSMNASSSDT